MSFLRDYMVYASNNEAPTMFHIWAGYTALSAAIARKVWLPFGVSAIYPNIYVLLVGPAGNGKSRAMYNCKKLMSAVSPEIFTVQSQATAPGVWRLITGDKTLKPPIASPAMELVMWPGGFRDETHPLFIRANEFINFIKPDPDGWISALNDIYDEDTYIYLTKNMGTDKIRGPYVVMLGGLTDSIAHNLQKQNIIASGFARRTIFQYGERNFDDPHAILSQSPEELAAFERCIVHLNRLRTLCGEVRWDQDTQEWWTAWYNAHSRDTPNHSPQIRSWFTSKPDQVLKIGLLNSLSEGFDLVLTAEHLEGATNSLAVMEQNLYRIFGGIGRNELAAIATQVYDFVSGLREPMSKKQLRLKLFSLFSAKDGDTEFEECLRYLCAEGRLRTYSMQVGSYIDPIVATPEVLQVWAARTGVRLSAVPVDEVQRALNQGLPPTTGPLPPRDEAPQNGREGGRLDEPQSGDENEADRFPKLP